VTGHALDGLNTLGVPSAARSLHVLRSVDDLAGLDRVAREEGLVVLGGGSNVVLGEWLETPVCLVRIRGIEARESGDRVEVTAAAGESWHGLVRWTLGRGYSGLENLALIPGSVGAAPVQNIGAYGVELDERFVALTAFDLEAGEVVRFDPKDCAFGYRTSLFKTAPGRFLILSVSLSLDNAGSAVVTEYEDVRVELERMGRPRPRPIDVAEAVIRVRRRKLPDPRFVPNAGSFFKNPVVSTAEFERLGAAHGALKGRPDANGVKLAAAELIDRCGFKADTTSPVRVWPRQPLVLINPERRPAREVLARADAIRRRVREAFGIRLETEPDTFAC
jgi:UDP-N-acetylmuramate dehydrogenase